MIRRMIFFIVFTALWFLGGVALGRLTSTLNTGLYVVVIAPIVWGLVVGVGLPAPQGVLSPWEVGGIACLHMPFMVGLGFAIGMCA